MDWKKCANVWQKIGNVLIKGRSIGFGLGVFLGYPIKCVEKWDIFKITKNKSIKISLLLLPFFPLDFFMDMPKCSPAADNLSTDSCPNELVWIMANRRCLAPSRLRAVGQLEFAADYSMIAKLVQDWLALEEVARWICPHRNCVKKTYRRALAFPRHFPSQMDSSLFPLG